MSDSPPPIGFRLDISSAPTPYPLGYALAYGNPMEHTHYNQASTLNTIDSTSSSSYCFQQCSAGEAAPDGVVRAGVDADGTQIYVGRAEHEGEIIPAKVMFDKQIAYIPYNGQEIAKYQFEVLRTGTFVWESSGYGQVPYGAVVMGHAENGEKLYMGRCIHEGSQTPGKIQISHGCLYIPFGGTEVRVTEYEVLVLK